MDSGKADQVVAHEIDWDDEKVARLWDYYSHTPPYSNLYVAKRFGDRILRKSGLPLGRPIKVLDFGCGPGFIWDHLVGFGAQWIYTAADFSASSVQALAQRVGADPRCAGVHHVTGLPTKFEAESFDAILLLEVVEHLKDEYLENTLEEMRRLLKRGGILVLTTPNEEDLSEVKRFCPECGTIFHQWQHVRSWGVASLTRKLQQHSFDLQKHTALNLEITGLKRRMFEVIKTAFGEPRRAPHLIASFVRR